MGDAAEDFRAVAGEMVRLGARVVAAMSSRGWWATMDAPVEIREAIWSLPNTATAADIAREANKRKAERT